MPILRLTKTDFAVPVDAFTDMALAFTGYDSISYNFNWTGRGGLLPISAVEKAVNPNTRQAMMRSIWIATDSSSAGFWGLGDTVSHHSSRFGLRATGTDLTQAIIRVGVASPHDRISFMVGAKAQEYAIEIFINSLDEGDFGFPEMPLEK